MTNDSEKIVCLASSYAAHKGLAVSTVSLRAANHGSWIDRLAAGSAGLTVQRRDKVLQWFSDHWPTDLSWPPDIPRPAPHPTETEDAA